MHCKRICEEMSFLFWFFLNEAVLLSVLQEVEMTSTSTWSRQEVEWSRERQVGPYGHGPGEIVRDRQRCRHQMHRYISNPARGCGPDRANPDRGAQRRGLDAARSGPNSEGLDCCSHMPSTLIWATPACFLNSALLILNLNALLIRSQKKRAKQQQSEPNERTTTALLFSGMMKNWTCTQWNALRQNLLAELVHAGEWSSDRVNRQAFRGHPVVLGKPMPRSGRRPCNHHRHPARQPSVVPAGASADCRSSTIRRTCGLTWPWWCCPVRLVPPTLWCTSLSPNGWCNGGRASPSRTTHPWSLRGCSCRSPVPCTTFGRLAWRSFLLFERADHSTDGACLSGAWSRWLVLAAGSCQSIPLQRQTYHPGSFSWRSLWKGWWLRFHFLPEFQGRKSSSELAFPDPSGKSGTIWKTTPSPWGEPDRALPRRNKPSTCRNRRRSVRPCGPLVSWNRNASGVSDERRASCLPRETQRPCRCQHFVQARSNGGEFLLENWVGWPLSKRSHPSVEPRHTWF